MTHEFQTQPFDHAPVKTAESRRYRRNWGLAYHASCLGMVRRGELLTDLKPSDK